MLLSDTCSGAQTFSYHLCREHWAWSWGGRSNKEGRKLLSDPMGRCEVYNLPVSTHPPPHFHMQRNYSLCVGGWGSWLSANTPTVCSEKWRRTAICICVFIYIYRHKVGIKLHRGLSNTPALANITGHTQGNAELAISCSACLLPTFFLDNRNWQGSV